MKKLQYLILALTLILISCERDDICAEGTSTTPRLFVEFYDVEEPEDLKSVNRLTVYGEGLILDEDGMETEPTQISDGIVINDETYIFNINRNSVYLPLRIDDDIDNDMTITSFVLEKDTNFRLDEDNPNSSNTDIIEISYNSIYEYVSRACGYKSTFDNLAVTLENDSDNWISNIEVDVENVENENTVHVRIFH